MFLEENPEVAAEIEAKLRQRLFDAEADSPEVNAVENAATYVVDDEAEQGERLAGEPSVEEDVDRVPLDDDEADEK